MPTIWNATLHPGIPMNVTGAINTEQRPLIIEPELDVSCSHPKAAPRLLSSVESASNEGLNCWCNNRKTSAVQSSRNSHLFEKS
jgi:hypothetical protein